jgi:probable HAF family extracellular repeat protein
MRTNKSLAKHWVLGSNFLLAVATFNVSAADQYRIVDLGDLGGGSANHLSYAFDINDRGDVVGYSKSADGKDHAFYWSRGTLTDLGEGRATSINNHRQLVGWSTGPNYMKWHYNGADFDLPIDLGIVRAPKLGPTVKINEMGEVAGTAGDSHSYVFWKDGVATTITYWLGCIPASVTGLNNRGVVAHSDPNNYGNPLLFSPSGYDTSFTHIFTGAANYIYPTALNDAGEVVGWTGDFNNSGQPQVGLWDINNAGIAVGTMGNGTYGSYQGSLAAAQISIYHAVISTDQGASITDLNGAGLVSNLASEGWTKLVVASAINDAGQIVGVGVKGTQTRAFLLTPVLNY